MRRQTLMRALLVALLATPAGCSVLGMGGDPPPAPEAPPAPVRTPDPAPAPDSTQAAAEEPARAMDEDPIESVSVVVTSEERKRLLGEARADLARITELCGDLDASTLGDDGREKLRAIERLVLSANDALEEDDPVAAANLSHKARLLAEELVEG